MSIEEKLTVVVPTSPIPSHPSTSLIEQTLWSVRYHLPKVRILIQCDGVRPEQEHFRSRYEEYKTNLATVLRQSFPNAEMRAADQFLHQAAMYRKFRPSTPLLLYVEHDLAFFQDPIDFAGIIKTVEAGEVNLMRIHYWSKILDEHKHLMLDTEPRLSQFGVPYIRTVQYSQHPHVARADFYDRLLSNYSPECRTMIETKAYALVVNAPWEEWKCAIYAPEGNMRRLHHLHGRQEEPKWEEGFIF